MTETSLCEHKSAVYLLLCLERIKHHEPELKSESEHKSMYTQMVSPETVGERCRIYSGWMKGVQDLIRIIALTGL